LSTEREVLVVGGGPTGSIVATMLARSGHQVLLVCEERREGGLPVETVVPGAITTLERLGLTCAVGECAIPGPARHGRCWSSSALDIEDLDDSHRGWRFLRPALDRWLRARARESGVEVMQATRATGPLPKTGCGEVKLEQAGRTITIETGLVIAATGRASGSPLLPVEVVDRLPDMIAISTVVDGEPADADASVVEAVAEGWIWWLPFADGRSSLALFCDPAEVRDRGRDEVWTSALRAAVGPAATVESAQLRGTLATARLHRATGNLLLAGDAISAIDPLSSQGLEKALVSAESTALAARTVLIGESDLETMVETRGRWERRLFRMHRQRALDLYRSEGRFIEHPFWSARHRLMETNSPESSAPTGRLTPASDLLQSPRWVPDGDRLVARDGLRLSSSDEESIDQIGSIPTRVLMELVGDGIEMRHLHQRVADVPYFIDQSPAHLRKILQEMCRLGLLVES
jgi:flavin-dependent dehydrogenase